MVRQCELNSRGTLINTTPTFLSNWFSVKTTFRLNLASGLLFLPHTCTHTHLQSFSLFLPLCGWVHFPFQSASSLQCIVGKCSAEGHWGGNRTQTQWRTLTHVAAAAAKMDNTSHTHTLWTLTIISVVNVNEMRTSFSLCIFSVDVVKHAASCHIHTFRHTRQGQAVHTPVWR